MKLSLQWLGEFVTWKEKDLDAIVDRLTLSVAEVEEVEKQGALLGHCCVGKVLSIARHPNADRLSLVDVETDRGKKRVVCGGTNLRDGMLVAFAHVGATVKWHGEEMMTLAPVKIRGEASEGMICAAVELGLESRFPQEGEHDIIDLSGVAGLRAGMDLRGALGLDDVILHVSNTAITHRPDLFSHVGFARECVAAGLATWKKTKEPAKPRFTKDKIPFRTILEDKNLVPRYCACLLTIDGVGQTPAWMRKRLEATGWRSINLPIDITNYVATEIGMPLHSFDADDIRGDVHMRGARKGESVTTLDGVDRKLPDGAVVLSDDEGIFDLLGIMGGLRSSTKESTRRIYLHSAIVDPVAIRKAVVATGHRTDAATVYEKGIPPVTAMRGFQRALELFLELVPGARVASAMEDWGADGKPAAITVAVDRMQSFIGAPVTPKEAATILEGLGCTVKATKTALTVTPPLHRIRDLKTDADVIEEIARLHGYDTLAEALPAAPLRIPERDKRMDHVRDALKEELFSEIVPLSLVSAALLSKANLSPADAVGVQHPLSEDTAVLHTSTLPSLLAHAQRNILQAGDTLRTFHWGHVFSKRIPEHAELSALVAAMRQTTTANDPFLELKRSLVFALREAGYALSIGILRDIPTFAHPGRCAALIVDGKAVGAIYEVHPTVRSRFDLPHRAAAATVNLELLLSIAPATRMAKSLPQFPAVAYDETIKRTHAKAFGPLLEKLAKAHPLLEHVEVHDLYAGAPLKADEYNLTLRFTYRSPERTLTEDEVKQAHKAVMGVVS